jgi:hypothetical protein
MIDIDQCLSAAASGAYFHYTRYADDLFYSGPTDDWLSDVGTGQAVDQLISDSRLALKKAGFEVNRYKTHVWHKSIRQRVTGLTVNVKPNIPRPEWRKFRSFLHCVEVNEIQPFAAKYAQGYMAFVQMIDAYKAEKLRRQYPWIWTTKSDQPGFDYSQYRKFCVHWIKGRGLFIIDKEKRVINLTTYDDSDEDYCCNNGRSSGQESGSRATRIFDSSTIIHDDRLRKAAIGKYLSILPDILRQEREQNERLKAEERNLQQAREAANRIRAIEQKIRETAISRGISEAQFEVIRSSDQYVRHELFSMRTGFHAWLSPDENDYYGISWEGTVSALWQPSPFSKWSTTEDATINRLISYFDRLANLSVGSESPSFIKGRQMLAAPRALLGDLNEVGIPLDRFAFLLESDIYLLVLTVFVCSPRWHSFGREEQFWSVAASQLGSLLTRLQIDSLRYRFGAFVNSDQISTFPDEFECRQVFRQRLDMFKRILELGPMT